MVSLPADRSVNAGRWVTLTATSTDAACEWTQMSGTTGASRCRGMLLS